MAGYMTKLQGYVYEGELVNNTGAAIENGAIVVISGGKFVLPAADTDTKFVCKEVTDVYGLTAYRFYVEALAKNYYLVENGYEFNDQATYDNRTYVTAQNAYLRAHPLVVGEEFVTTMVTGTPAAGTAYGVKADGTVG